MRLDDKSCNDVLYTDGVNHRGVIGTCHITVAWYYLPWFSINQTFGPNYIISYLYNPLNHPPFDCILSLILHKMLSNTCGNSVHKLCATISSINDVMTVPVKLVHCGLIAMAKSTIQYNKYNTNCTAQFFWVRFYR